MRLRVYSSRMTLRIALRKRWRDWPTSLTFVVIIGLAVAVTGAWLAIAYPVLLGRMPYPEPDRLVAIESVKKGQSGGLSWLTLEDLRTDSVESMAVYWPRTWGFQTDPKGHVEVVLSQQVTGEFFDTLGVQPALGERLTRLDEQTDRQAFVWLSHGAWLRLLGGNPAAVLRTVWINAVAYRVAGVLPASFQFPHQGEEADIYIPLNRTDFYWRGAGQLGAVARLKRGVSRQQFASELEARAGALAAAFPDTNRDLHFTTRPLGLFLLGERLTLVGWMSVAVLILLLISMANASGVWLAQWLKQQRNASIKRSLGASFSWVILEQSIQAGLLGLAAVGLGLLGAAATLGLLRASPLIGPELTRFELWHPASLDAKIIALLILIAMVTSLVAATVPMVLKVRHSGRTRLALAVVQLTLTGTLAYSGILVWRNVQSLLNTGRGFRTEQVLISGIGIPEAVYNTDEKMICFHQRAIEELARIPGVTAAAGGGSLPVSNWRTLFQVDDDRSPRDSQPRARIGAASPGLLQILQIPLRQGRGFDVADSWNTPRVALVNESFARKYLPNGAIGHRIRPSFYNGSMKPYMDHVVIGVVGDTLNRDLSPDSEPQILLSANQIPLEGFHYFTQSSLPAESLKQAVAQAIWRVDPAIERIGVKPLAEHVERSLMSRRTLALLLALFGGLSLAIVGFGLTSSLTATFLEMMRELGIRSALGATPARLAFESTRWGAWAIGMSWALTLPLCVAVSSRVVFDRVPAGLDVASFGAAATVLAVIGVAAGWIPVRRAAGVDPASTLRSH